MQIADRMKRLKGLRDAFSGFNLVRDMLEQGVDLVNFTKGDPDFDTPVNIAEAGIEAIRDGHTHYSTSLGISTLRNLVAETISASRNIAIDPMEVVIAPGAKILVTYALMALVNDGDEVIFPNPGYPTYPTMIEFVGAKPVPMPMVEERSFSFDPEKLKDLVTDKTKMIIINSPNNPTGGVLSSADLQIVADIARDCNAWVLSDEVYSKMVYDGEFKSIVSIPGMKERTILLDSFSKTYAMTGWRLGYGVVPAPVAQEIDLLAGNIHSSTAEFTQYAGMEALQGSQESVRAMVKEYQERRDIIWEGLRNIPGITCVKPEGAFYVFPNVSGACKNLGLNNANDLQELLLREGHVAVNSSSYYYQSGEFNENPQNLRLTYALSIDRILDGLRRMRETIGK